MQPQSRNDAFQPKWRHFHAQSTVWVQNPLSHDIEFQVADEYDTPYRYLLGAGKISELPGGAVATLGVKAIVDELIQNNKNDVLRIWDKDVRHKYEDEIILRIKEAPVKEERTVSGKIDLTVNDNVEAEVDAEAPVIPPFPAPPEESHYAEEQAFPDVEAKKAATAATAKLPASKTIEE